MVSSTPHENHLEMVINRAQFDACTPSTLELINKNEKIFALRYRLAV